MKSTIFLSIITIFLGTTFSMAEEVVSTQSEVVEEDSWFGDSYEEDGCYCN